MATLINDIHNFLDFLRNRGEVKYFTPEDIDRAVYAAVLDKFDEEVNEFKKTGKLSDVLQAFKEYNTLSPSSGFATLPTDFAYALGFSSVISSVEYEGEIRDETTWNSRDMSDLMPDESKPDNPLHWYTKEESLVLSGGKVALPQNFVKALGFLVTISGEDYRGHIRDSHDWGRRTKQDILDHQDLENPEDPFHWFRRKDVISLTSGEGDLPNDFVEPISVAAEISGKEYDASIRDLKDFHNKEITDLIPDKESPTKPLHWYEDVADLTTDANGEVVLPDNFVQELGIASTVNSKEYAGEIREAKDFHRANAEDLKADLENEQDPMHYYKKNATLSLTSDKANLPNDFIRPLSFSVIIGGKEYQGYFLDDEKWLSRGKKDLIPDEGTPKDPLHFYRKTATLTLVSKQADLPEDCVEVEEVAADVGGDPYEVEEVERSKWNSRLRSTTIPPEEQHAIYKVENGKIKVEPTLASTSIDIDYLQYPCDKRPIGRHGDSEVEVAPTGLSSIRLYYLGFPVAKHIVAKIADNKVYVLPKGVNNIRLYFYKFPVAQRAIAAFYDGKIKVEPISLSSMNLYYLAFPVQKMPVMRIIGDEIECDPLTSETIKFQFLQFPVDKRPIGRIANDQIEVSPSTLTSIRLYYLRKPAKPTWAYTISGDGRSHVYDEGSSVDIDMPEFIWQTIANKALEYLGVAMDDNMLTQFQQFNKKGKLDD